MRRQDIGRSWSQLPYAHIGLDTLYANSANVLVHRPIASAKAGPRVSKSMEAFVYYKRRVNELTSLFFPDIDRTESSIFSAPYIFATARCVEMPILTVPKSEDKG